MGVFDALFIRVRGRSLLGSSEHEGGTGHPLRTPRSRIYESQGAGLSAAGELQRRFRYGNDGKMRVKKNESISSTS
jgi:hypothetical protein